MSLYRTWRPRTFADLVGQDAVVKTLTTALETGRLAHAYLFSGPRGSGKTSAAKILARCIDCVNGPTATPDNTCANCVAILEGTALDVLEIDAASNRGIDEIRALRDAVRFAPSAMRKKVYIIDEAHMLTKEGANAFLKTLEEPPEWAVFILATTAPEALPPTILSRCQRYAFRRIAIPTMIARMREIAAAEGIVIDAAALGAIAYRADGGLRDALTMLEQVSAFATPSTSSGQASVQAIDAATVDAAFGQSGLEFARTLRDTALDGDAAHALRVIDDASDAGTDMTGLIRAVTQEFRHLLVARVNPELLARDLAEDDARIARERAAATPQARLVRALRLLADALAAARNSGNARLELESAVLRFVLQGEDPALDALAARLTALERGEPALRQAQDDKIIAQPDKNTAQFDKIIAPHDKNTAHFDKHTAPPDKNTAQFDKNTAPHDKYAAPPDKNTAQHDKSTAQRDQSAAQHDQSTAPHAHSTAQHEKYAAPRDQSTAQHGEATLHDKNTAKDDKSTAQHDAVSARVDAPVAQTTRFAPAASEAAGPRPDVSLSSSKGAPEASAPKAGATRMDLSLQKLRTLWQSIRMRAESEKGSLRAGLSRATVAALDGDVLTLRVPDAVTGEMLKRDAVTLKKAIAEVTGRSLDVRVAVRAAGPPPDTGVAEEDGDVGDDLMRYALEKLS